MFFKRKEKKKIPKKKRKERTSQ
jgi:hypothetical protein